MLIPLPFVTINDIRNNYDFMPGSQTGNAFSVVLLGIMPYVSAYVLVEIFSLFTPFLKKLRGGSFEGRRKLKRIALVLTLPIALWQANQILDDLAGMYLANGSPVLTLSSPLENFIVVCTMVVSCYLLVAVSELITRFGIGHGISIIILSGICGDITQRVPRYLELFKECGLAPYVIALTASLFFIAGAYILLTCRISVPCYHEKDAAPVGYFQLNLAPSSREAVVWATSFIMLPFTLGFFFEIDDISKWYNPGSLAYNLALIVFIFIFSYLFSRAFLHPRRRVATMRERGWHFAVSDMPAEKFLLSKQFKYTVLWTIYLCILTILPTILIYSTDIPFYIGGSSTVIIVAISLDLMCGFEFYKHNLQQPIKIAEFHDIYDANMIKNHVEAEGVPCYLRGYHHRLLSYFFGPHIEMSLIINKQDTGHVQTLIQDYYGGLGLCRNSTR